MEKRHLPSFLIGQKSALPDDPSFSLASALVETSAASVFFELVGDPLALEPDLSAFEN